MPAPPSGHGLAQPPSEMGGEVAAAAALPHVLAAPESIVAHTDHAVTLTSRIAAPAGAYRWRAPLPHTSAVPGLDLAMVGHPQAG